MNFWNVASSTKGYLRARTFPATDNQHTLGRKRRSHKGGMDQGFVVLFFVGDIRLDHAVKEERPNVGYLKVVLLRIVVVVDGDMLVRTLDLGNLILVLVNCHDFNGLELRILQDLVLVQKGSAGNKGVGGSRHISGKFFHNVIQQVVQLGSFSTRKEIDQGAAVFRPRMNGKMTLGQHGYRTHALRIELGALDTQQMHVGVIHNIQDGRPQKVLVVELVKGAALQIEQEVLPTGGRQLTGRRRCARVGAA